MTKRCAAALPGLALALAPMAPASAQLPASRYGTREPVTCGTLKSPPSAAQIKMLLQCRYEDKTNEAITLLANISVEIGSPRPYIYNQDSYNTNIDTTARVLPIRGSYDSYRCAQLSRYTNVGTVYDTDNTGKNCMVKPEHHAEGSCYRTTFGDWQCNMMEATDPSLFRADQPPPQ